MILNLYDPASIVAWWASYPARHWAYLEHFEVHAPDCREAVRVARQQIRRHPDFHPGFEASQGAAWHTTASRHQRADLLPAG